MLKLLKGSTELGAEFCDRCAKVRAAGCRTAVVGDRALALRLGMRL